MAFDEEELDVVGSAVVEVDTIVVASAVVTDLAIQASSYRSL